MGMFSMDSVTQFVLGACVGTAVLGRRLGPRKAAVLGGVLATLPDLDVFFPYDGPVDSFTLHRGPSHSLLVQTLVTPVVGEMALRLFARFREDGAARHRWAVYLAVFLAFTTHALLDSLTIYGTQLFWPVSTEPIGLGSIFIIDPLYTVPLIIMTIWAVCLSQWGSRFRKGLVLSLVLSTSYLAWSTVGQSIAENRALLAVGGAQSGDRVKATPTPFNTLFWKVLILREDDYLNVYVPLLGGDDQITAYKHPRNWQALGCATNLPDVQQVAGFSQGFVRLERDGDTLRIADLRMGLTPNYVFRFEVGEFGAGAPHAVSPAQVPGPRSDDADVDWILAGLRGEAIPRAVEAGSELTFQETASMPDALPPTC